MAQNNCPVDEGDTVQFNYNGPGYDPVFDVENIENGYHITLSNGATVYPKDFDAGRLEVVN